jgi:hypothetical protein
MAQGGEGMSIADELILWLFAMGFILATICGMMGL